MDHLKDAPEDAQAGRGDGPRRLWRTRAERAADNAAARAQAARARIGEQRALDQARLEQLEAERERRRVQDELAAHAKQRAGLAAEERRGLRQRISLAVVLASANVGVNGAAILGQVLALTYGLKWQWWQAVPLALVVESVAVNVGFFAHDKLIKGYSAFWLRALSYGIGAGVGVFNYTHNAGLAQTNAFAGVFGAASLLSPVLWQIYSQWRHWDTMRAQGLLEERAARFPLLRWIIPSLRRETWEAFKHGVSESVRSPEVALAEVRARSAVGNAERAVRQAQQTLIGVQSDALRLALTHLAGVHHDLDDTDPAATEARQSIAHFMARFTPLIPAPAGLLPAPVAVTAPVDPVPDRGTAPEPVRPSEQDNEAAREFVRESIRRRKTVPAKSVVAAEFGFSDSWGYDRVREAREELAVRGWTFPEDGPPVSPAGSRRVPAASSGRGTARATAKVNGHTPGGAA